MGQIHQCNVSPSPRALMAVTQRWWRQHTRRSQGGAGPFVASSRMVRMITSITPVVGDADFLLGSALAHHSLPLMSSQPEGVAAWLWCWVFPWKRRWPASDPWPPVFEQVGAGTPPSRCLAGPVVAVVGIQDILGLPHLPPSCSFCCCCCCLPRGWQKTAPVLSRPEAQVRAKGVSPGERYGNVFIMP